MNIKNNTVLGKISLVILVLTLFCIIETTFHYIIFPIDFDNPNSTISIINQYGYIGFMCKILLCWINFILGIITLFQKKSNKKIAIIALIISLPTILTGITAFVQGLIIGFEM